MSISPQKIPNTCPHTHLIVNHQNLGSGFSDGSVTSPWQSSIGGLNLAPNHDTEVSSTHLYLLWMNPEKVSVCVHFKPELIFSKFLSKMDREFCPTFPGFYN